MSFSDPRLLLRAVDFLQHLPLEVTEALAASLSPFDVGAGVEVLRRGEAGDGMFLVAEGEVEVLVPGASEVTLARLGPGSCFGEIQAITGGLRTATVRTRSACRLFALSHAALMAAIDPCPGALASLVEVVRRRIYRTQLVAVLARVFGGLPLELLAGLQERARWVSLKRAEALFDQGDEARCWYAVLSGSLEIHGVDAGGQTYLRFEVPRGITLGEGELLAGIPRLSAARAAGETTLAALDRQALDLLLAHAPWVGLALLKNLMLHVHEGEGRAARGLGQSFALIPTRAGLPVDELTERLGAALGELESTLSVSPESVERLGVMANASLVGEEHPSWLALLMWLDEQRDTHRHVLMRALPSAEGWSRRCARQADLLLLIAHADDDPAQGALERALLETAGPVRRLLVLLHTDGSRAPRGTRRWLDARPVQGHIHVRLDRDDDIRRLARLLSGKAIGLALGGGGARGFAHIGVLRALREQNIPVDLIGGTSMGAIIAAQHALGMTPDEMETLNAKLTALRPFQEFTLPIISLLRTRRIEQIAQMAFGDVEIEDLWLGYVCVSSNLSNAEMIVHERGPVWEATRASGALPGIARPVLGAAGLLVDGGVINNLPGDVVRERCRGTTIVVNVSPDQESLFAVRRLPEPWEVLWGWLWPWAEPTPTPTITHILMRTVSLASAGHARKVSQQADLYIRPPVGHFGLLQFESLREIAAAGYRAAREALASWEGRP